MANDPDTLAKPRQSVAKAIADLRSFEGTAGTAEMQAVIAALDMLGIAYMYLEKPYSNPAWS